MKLAPYPPIPGDPRAHPRRVASSDPPPWRGGSQPPSRVPGPVPNDRARASGRGPEAGGAANPTSQSLRRLIGLLPFLLLAAVSFGFGPPKITDSDQPRMPLYPKQLVELARSKPPELKGSAVLVMDVATGRTVYEWNAGRRLAPASTTKMMTALVVLERAGLQEKVKVREEVLRPLRGTDSSVMGLVAGDTLTVEDLLYGLMVPSGNDAALVLADYVGGGSVEKFVAMMNDKAVQMGLRDTHFANPHGLDARDQYVTAADLATLARAGLQDPTFARLVATDRVEVGSTRRYLLRTTNELLQPGTAVSGADGIKTGTSDDAGSNLVASVTRDDHRVIVVVLGTKDRLTEATRFIEYAFSAFAWRPLQAPPYPRMVDGGGHAHEVGFYSAREEMVPKWQRHYLTSAVKLDRRSANPSPGAPVGVVSYAIAGVRVADIALSVR
jgi:D-alanyl-D-alanine carboxypeptidase